MELREALAVHPAIVSEDALSPAKVESQPRAERCATCSAPLGSERWEWWSDSFGDIPLCPDCAKRLLGSHDFNTSSETEELAVES